jgi:hypothetical protein
MGLVTAEVSKDGFDGSLRRSPSTVDCHARKSLTSTEPWDRYHLESLLPLKEMYRENSQFGFLLRHYWIPATALTFQQSTVKTFSNGEVSREQLRVDRFMARCRSNECTWREMVYSQRLDNRSELTWESQPRHEVLCSYDCYDQTYTEDKPIRFRLPLTNEEKLSARQRALSRMPILVPAGPVPIGFEWYCKVGDDYMNFRLEAEEALGETSVLHIRREGRFAVRMAVDGEVARNGLERDDMNTREEVAGAVIERRGLTLFAWNRGAVLEDRCMDRVVETEESLQSLRELTTKSVFLLVRSAPMVPSSPEGK